MNGGAPETADPREAYVERLRNLPDVHRRVAAAGSVGELFSVGAELARTECGFDRAVVLSVEGGRLTAAETDALADRASDRLRRRILAHPIELGHDTVEAELIRRGTRPAGPPAGHGSALAGVLDLGHHAIGIVAPESRPLALLVLDRDGPVVDPLEEDIVSAFAAMLALALEHVILRARISDLAHELQFLTTSAQAMMSEVLAAPLSLPSTRRHGPAFPRAPGVTLTSEERLRERFNERERTVADFLVQGKSNREIAEAMMLSPETVKGYVGRILRKLGAANRVEAVSLYLQLTQR